MITARPVFTTPQGDPAEWYARRIFCEAARLDPRLRGVSHWVIDTRTWQIVRDIHASAGWPLAIPVFDPDAFPEVGRRVKWILIGFPVLLDDDHGESLRLVCNGGVRSARHPHRCPSCGGTHG